MKTHLPTSSRRHHRPSPHGPRLLLALAAAFAASSALAVPVINNPSFEANAFTTGPGFSSSPGNGPITGWTSSDLSRTGLSPIGLDETFADNGLVPNGSRVAFLHSITNITTTLSTTITGLVAGKHYKLEFRYNRQAAAVATGAGYRIDGGPTVPIPISSAVQTTGSHTLPYRTLTRLFVATGPTALLEFSNTTPGATTLLIDHFTIVEAVPIQVANANNDGVGSLRQTLITAAGTPAFNVITFAAALSGQKVKLFSRIDINDPGGVAIDASALPKGLTIAGSNGGVFGNFQTVTPTHFRGLTITGGSGNSGAIEHFLATLVISRCTFSNNGNSATQGGALGVINTATAIISQCTFNQNGATSSGGAMFFGASTVGVIDHCTISGNSATSSGGGITNTGRLVLSNSIVAGNNAAGNADIVNSGAGASFTRLGNNIVQSFTITGGATDGGGNAPINANPALDLLFDNGGPTKTMAEFVGSPARNASLGSTVTTDQRGLAVQVAPDLGAYEVQPGAFFLAVADNTGAENAGTKTMTVIRVDGFEGIATVNASATVGTAGAADFTPFNNQVVSFSDTEQADSFNVTINNDLVPEPGEVFHVTLSNPTGGATIATPATLTMVILDNDAFPDTTAPPAPVILTPAEGALVNYKGDITVTGTASDNDGVASMTVNFLLDDNTAIPVSAVLESPFATSTKWSASLFTGVAFTKVRATVVSFDPDNRASPTAVRNFKQLHPLEVQLHGNGTVNAGFAPVSFREIGLSYTVTATPGPGSIFAGWSVNGYMPQDIGLVATDLEKRTLNFTFRQNLQLVANFIPSPFGGTIAGNYRGLIECSGSSISSVTTEGVFNATVMPTGAFSGTLTLDGTVLNVAGEIDPAGVARFGTSRATFVRVTRVGKPSLIFRFSMPSPGGVFQPILNGTVESLNFRNELENFSFFNATRAHFNGTTVPVPPQFLGPANANQVYNVILRPVDWFSQPVLQNALFFPQGTGFGRITVTKAGVVTLTDCTLADGTTGVTASTFLDNQMACVLFIPLYNKRGFLRARPTFNTAGADTDFDDLATGKWCRPAQNTHHYHDGWPEVILVGFEGAKFTVPSGESVLRSAGNNPISAPEPDGNANIVFRDGQLSTNVIRFMNVATNDAVTKIPVNDPTFNLTITRATGLLNGTFRHTDGYLIPFKGILHQKGNLAGGWGFFLTQPTVPIDYSGESGHVNLIGEP